MEHLIIILGTISILAIVLALGGFIADTYFGDMDN